MFELHVVLLSLAYLEGCLSEEGEDWVLGVGCWGLGVEEREQPLVGQYQHGVARENGGVSIPALMYRGMSTSQVSIVHKVVVQQRVVMISLKGHGRHEDVFGLILIKLIREQHECWPDALSAKGEHILYGFVE